MSVKVQAKVNSSVDYAALEEELWWKVYEVQQPRVRAEMAAWKAVRPVYESQEALRAALARETERVEAVKRPPLRALALRAQPHVELNEQLARRQAPSFEQRVENAELGRLDVHLEQRDVRVVEAAQDALQRERSCGVRLTLEAFFAGAFFTAALLNAFSANCFLTLLFSLMLFLPRLFLQVF